MCEQIINLKPSFKQNEFTSKGKSKRREKFLGEIEWVEPWARRDAFMAPVYPSGKLGGGGADWHWAHAGYLFSPAVGLAGETLEGGN